MVFSLLLRSVSAAGQAITTYIRNHMQRCETQGDHPLLLRHILSGTSSDDELLPALHSRTGGAHCTLNSESRSTNFRRGTMIWYLSRATGVPCPFTRVGIRLCEYGENGKVGLNGSRERKKERDRLRRSEQCGQKRKRQLRGYRGSDQESSEDGKKPPKVKLTLRLRPCALSQSPASVSPSSSSTNVIDLSKESDSDDSRARMMSVDSSSDEEEPAEADVPWSLPPYPKRSISIPCYTPCVDTFPSFLTESPSYSMASPTQGFVRSSSVPFSVASPPPDSEDEDDDYHISMTGSRPFFNDIRPTPETDPDWDFDFDSDGERETQWESPGPRSPSAPLPQFGHDVLVKQEPKDVEGVQGMLDHWEPLDSNIDSNKVVEVVAKAAAGLIDESSMSKVKVEELEFWDWQDNYGSANADWYRQSEEEQEAIHIKQEDVEPDCAFMFGDDSLMPPAGEDEDMLYSPLSPLPASPSQSYNSAALNVSISAPNTSGLRRHSELTWKDVELLGPDSVHPHEFEDGEWQEGNGNRTVRMRAKTQSSLPTFEPGLDFSSLSATRPPEASTVSVVPSDNSTFVRPNLPIHDPPTPDQASESPRAPVSSVTPAEERSEACEIVVVHTCQPCTPAISATQVEGKFLLWMNAIKRC
jgi:hypothetical protein